jgi:hypothetical protein
MILHIRSDETERSWKFTLNRLPEQGLVELISQDHEWLRAQASNLHDAIDLIRKAAANNAELEDLVRTIEMKTPVGLPQFQDGKPIQMISSEK